MKRVKKRSGKVYSTEPEQQAPSRQLKNAFCATHVHVVLERVLFEPSAHSKRRAAGLNLFFTFQAQRSHVFYVHGARPSFTVCWGFCLCIKTRVLH